MRPLAGIRVVEAAQMVAGPLAGMILAEQGADYDQVNEGGWAKVNELFRGKVACDSARVYLATNVCRAEDDE